MFVLTCSTKKPNDFNSHYQHSFHKIKFVNSYFFLRKSTEIYTMQTTLFNFTTQKKLLFLYIFLTLKRIFTSNMCIVHERTKLSNEFFSISTDTTELRHGSETTEINTTNYNLLYSCYESFHCIA